MEKEETSNDKEPVIKFAVRGTLGNGLFYIKTKCDSENDCYINRCELAIKETPVLKPEEYEDKFLVIYDRQRQGPIHNEKN